MVIDNLNSSIFPSTGSNTLLAQGTSPPIPSPGSSSAPMLVPSPSSNLPVHRKITVGRRGCQNAINNLDGAPLANRHANSTLVAAVRQDESPFTHKLDGLLRAGFHAQPAAAASFEVYLIHSHPASPVSSSRVKCLSVEVSFSSDGHRISREREAV